MADLAQLLAQAQAQREAQNPLLAGARSVQEGMGNSFTPQNLRGVNGGDVALAAIAGALASGGMNYFGRKQEDDTKAAENAALAQALQSNDPAKVAASSEVLRQHPGVLLGLQDRSTEIANKNDEQTRLWQSLGHKRGANGAWEIDPNSLVMQRLTQDKEQNDARLAEEKRYHDLSNSTDQQRLAIQRQQMINEDTYQKGTLQEKIDERKAKEGAVTGEGFSASKIPMDAKSDLVQIATDQNTAKQLGIYTPKTPGVTQANQRTWEPFLSGSKGKPDATGNIISLESIIKNIDILDKSDGSFRSQAWAPDMVKGAKAGVGFGGATERDAYNAIQFAVIKGDLSNLSPVTDIDVKRLLGTAIIGDDWDTNKKELRSVRDKLIEEKEVNNLVLELAAANPTYLNNISVAQAKAAMRGIYRAQQAAAKKRGAPPPGMTQKEMDAIMEVGVED